MNLKAGIPVLAIDGGTPVRSSRLPYGRQTIDAADVAAVVDALYSDFLTTGPRVAQFEEAFAAAVGARFAVALSSGTAALHAAAAAARLGPGTEAVTTPMTFAASANAVRYVGGDVVFADVRRDTLSIDPGAVTAAITPRTRAIVAVDYAGQPSDLDELRAIAARHGLVLIEDACHALGATYRGRRVGGCADMTAFSLHPVKHITAGEGGVVTTDDAKLAEQLRRFRNHGISIDYRKREEVGSWHYEIDDLGFNYRLTDVQCALAQSQLARLDRGNARRRAIADFYTRELRSMPEVELPTVLPDRTSAWHIYVVRLNLERLRVDRSAVFSALQAENVGVNVHYIPVPWHPYYQNLGFRRGAWSTAESEYERLLTIPLFPGMTDEDAWDVVQAVRKVVSVYKL